MKDTLKNTSKSQKRKYSREYIGKSYANLRYFDSAQKTCPGSGKGETREWQWRQRRDRDETRRDEMWREGKTVERREGGRGEERRDRHILPLIYVLHIGSFLSAMMKHLHYKGNSSQPGGGGGTIFRSLTHYRLSHGWLGQNGPGRG